MDEAAKLSIAVFNKSRTRQDSVCSESQSVSVFSISSVCLSLAISGQKAVSSLARER
jgi:hypothetical protein